MNVELQICVACQVHVHIVGNIGHRPPEQWCGCTKVMTTNVLYLHSDLYFLVDDVQICSNVVQLSPRCNLHFMEQSHVIPPVCRLRIGECTKIADPQSDPKMRESKYRVEVFFIRFPHVFQPVTKRHWFQISAPNFGMLNVCWFLSFWHAASNIVVFSEFGDLWRLKPNRISRRHADAYWRDGRGSCFYPY